MRLTVVIALSACGGDGGPTDAPCVSSILYLNRTGGSFDTGPVDDAAFDRSSIIGAPRSLAPYPHDDVDWAATRQCIRDALLPFPVQVVEVDPAPTPHVELVFTTTYWGTPAATTHAIPDGCRSGHQVGFVFGDSIATDYRACQVAMIAYAQMTALLSYGSNCRDFLDRTMDCVPMRSFVDETVPCVDANDQPIECRCGGATQNTYRALAEAHRACP